MSRAPPLTAAVTGPPLADTQSVYRAGPSRVPSPVVAPPRPPATTTTGLTMADVRRIYRPGSSLARPPLPPPPPVAASVDDGLYTADVQRVYCALYTRMVNRAMGHASMRKHCVYMIWKNPNDHRMSVVRQQFAQLRQIVMDRMDSGKEGDLYARACKIVRRFYGTPPHNSSHPPLSYKLGPHQFASAYPDDSTLDLPTLD